MTSRSCPSAVELTRYLDDDLAPEARERVQAHLRACACCGAHERALRAVVADLRAASAHRFDLQAHVTEIVRKLPDTVPDGAGRKPRAARLGLWAAIAVAASLCIGYLGLRAGEPNGFQARGGAAAHTIARDVGVQTYAAEPSLRALTPGAAIAPSTPLTAGFRNLGAAPAYLLLFAVDAREIVHWITPAYTRADRDPAATPLAVSTRERLLDTTVVLDDVPIGPLRIVSVITPRASHVSDIESLPEPISGGAITRRLAEAEVRELRVEVRRAALGGAR